MEKHEKVKNKLFRYGFNSYGAFRVGKVKQMIHAPFVIFRQSYCDSCNGKLKIAWITQNIYEGTEEAKGKELLYGFSGRPVEYTFAIFQCSKCGQKVSIADKFYERHPKKLEKHERKYGDYRQTDDYHTYLDSLKRESEGKK